MGRSPEVGHYSRKLALTQPLHSKGKAPKDDEVGGVITTTSSALASSSGKLVVGSLALSAHPVLGTVFFAQAAGGASQLTQGFSLALGVMFLFGFIWGVLKIWSGANAISKGDPDGKAGIIAGIIIAGAAAIMGALFAIFGLSGAVLTPSF
jgi:hypothetical protein